jgi:hypothetical protein
VFENRVLRRMSGPEGVEVTGDWRKLQNEELLILYSSPNMVRMIKSRRTRWATNVERMGGKKNSYFLVGKSEGKESLGRPRLRWENILT